MLANTLVVSLFALYASAAAAQPPANPTGHWEGTITAPMGQIDFEVLHAGFRPLGLAPIGIGLSHLVVYFVGRRRD